MKTIVMKRIFERNRGTKAQAMTSVGSGQRSSYSWLAVLVCCFMLLLAVVSCAKQGPTAKPADVEYYTCTMHPSVRSQDPNAKCPICSMNLVPVMKRNRATGESENRGNAGTGHEHISGTTMPLSATNAMEEPSDFSVPTTRQQQIGVTYGAVEQRPFTHTIRSAGIVAADTQRRRDYVARVEGYVEKLFVFSRGELV